MNAKVATIKVVLREGVDPRTFESQLTNHPDLIDWGYLRTDVNRRAFPKDVTLPENYLEAKHDAVRGQQYLKDNPHLDENDEMVVAAGGEQDFYEELFDRI